jgi:CAAX prenyl protease-like protein
VKSEDSTAALLTPFLAILAAGMLSRAVSSTFEWWYALRFVAAAAALFVYRRQYAGLEWRPGWMAGGLGVLVFAIWFALDRATGAPQATAMPAALAGAALSVRILWIALRFLGATITVPIAEELAFRGYLLRRLISPDFETVSPRTFTLFSVVASSLLFGFMHGGRWLAGSLAGLAYSAALLRRGRIGDAMIAHAVTNVLLAVYVLAFNQWQLW